jgi:hypothetical protein
MTEQQEFELVARAAGIKLLRDPGGIYRDCTGLYPESNIFGAPIWNPKLDDGDSFRLMVNMGIAFCADKTIARAAQAIAPYKVITEQVAEDECAAARLAVWNCALEIAKGMQ